jgi:hypothetical protein
MRTCGTSFEKTVVRRQALKALPLLSLIHYFYKNHTGNAERIDVGTFSMTQSSPDREQYTQAHGR